MKVIRRIFIKEDGLLAITIDLDGQFEFNKLTYPDSRLKEMAKHLGGKGLFVMDPLMEMMQQSISKKFDQEILEFRDKTLDRFKNFFEVGLERKPNWTRSEILDLADGVINEMKKIGGE